MKDSYYFFSLSHGSVPAILSTIENLNTNNSPDINIIVTDEPLALFWQELIRKKNLSWKVTFLNTRIPGRFRNIFLWRKIKPTIKRLFESNFRFVRDSHFYCFGSGLQLTVFALIKLIARRNAVTFIELDHCEYPLMYNLRSLTVFLHARLFYGLDIKILKVNNQPYPYLSNHFFEKLKIQRKKYFPYVYDAHLLEKYNPVDDDPTAGKSILWLDDNCWLFEHKTNGNVHEVLMTIKEYIDARFRKDEVLYKCHPNPRFQSGKSASIRQEYAEYPSHIPADFILSNPGVKFVIGGTSTVLSTAAKNTSITTISYVKLIPFEDESFKKRVIEFLVKESDKKLVFLNSLEGLKILFKNDES